MNIVIFQRSIIYIIAMFYGISVTGLNIQQRGRADHGGQNYNVGLTHVILKTNQVQFGKNLSLTCIVEHECTVNSWSVKEQNGTYETVVRESTPFNRTKYGAHLSKIEQRTIYELIIYLLDKNDVNTDYRCDCDTHSWNITDIRDKLTFIKDTKETKDSSHNNVGYIFSVIGGIVLFSIIAVLLYICCFRNGFDADGTEMI